jgi:cyclomaltodextrinase
MKKLYKTLLLIVVFCFGQKLLTAQPLDTTYCPKRYVEINHPAWTKNATIYEVNLRQFTAEGNFKAFEQQLPRIKSMGIDIIWLMPIHPIGQKNRKGTLGSYYSVKDYYDVNPEFGTMEDFMALVKTIHSMGMYVIIDWVANHSSLDNRLVTEHPNWYRKNKEGNFMPTAWRDYDDIIEFDYSVVELRKYMTNALKYWVKTTDIDGFRCDVASFIPIDFWENARAELDRIKPVFMLAESESIDLHKKAFDMTYAWGLWDNLHHIACKGISIGSLTGGYIAEHISVFPKDGYRMTFIDNHDKNSWEGNQFSNFCNALPAAMVMSAIFDGMPLVYGGQEAGLDRSLKFFDKDPIQWKPHPFYSIYKKLFELKHKNEALWNGPWGGEMVRITNDKMDRVISFSREKKNDKVICIINLSNESASFNIDTNHDVGVYTELFTDKQYTFTGEDKIDMPAWGYWVLVK